MKKYRKAQKSRKDNNPDDQIRTLLVMEQVIKKKADSQQTMIDILLLLIQA